VDRTRFANATISSFGSSSATTKRFWCSALVAYVFDQLDLIEPVNWSVVTPRDFSLWSSRLSFRCSIRSEELVQ
jgi:hypothetical protein